MGNKDNRKTGYCDKLTAGEEIADFWKVGFLDV
jgi:hypothetical protein